MSEIVTCEERRDVAARLRNLAAKMRERSGSVATGDDAGGAEHNRDPRASGLRRRAPARAVR